MELRTPSHTNGPPLGGEGAGSAAVEEDSNATSVRDLMRVCTNGSMLEFAVDRVIRFYCGPYVARRAAGRGAPGMTTPFAGKTETGWAMKMDRKAV